MLGQGLYDQAMKTKLLLLLFMVLPSVCFGECKNDETTPEVIRYRKQLEDAGFNTSNISNFELLQSLVGDNKLMGGNWDTFEQKHGTRTLNLWLNHIGETRSGLPGKGWFWALIVGLFIFIWVAFIFWKQSKPSGK